MSLRKANLSGNRTADMRQQKNRDALQSKRKLAMTIQNLRWVDLAIGISFLLCGVAILFVIPAEALYQNGRRFQFGDIYRGLEAILGQHGARYFLALPFLAFGFLFLRKLFRQEKPARRSSPN